VDVLFLTHRDDVADHARWADRFGCVRVMHRADIGAGTADVEAQLDGARPWGLPLAETPGGRGLHPGGTVLGLVLVGWLLFSPPGTRGAPAPCTTTPTPESAGVLFTGDHLSLDEAREW